MSNAKKSRWRLIIMYKYIEPEVPASLGERTTLETNVHPPIVHTLDFQFERWLGDCLMECFPCFVVIESARKALENIKATGVYFVDMLISKGDNWDELYPGRALPKCYWAKIDGIVGQDDFGVAPDLRLVVSDRVIETLKPFGLKQAVLENFD
jgi:hypothetical protein